MLDPKPNKFCSRFLLHHSRLISSICGTHSPVKEQNLSNLLKRAVCTEVLLNHDAQIIKVLIVPHFTKYWKIHKSPEMSEAFLHCTGKARGTSSCGPGNIHFTICRFRSAGCKALSNT